MMVQRIVPDWPLQDRVSALTTTRCGGHSQPPYASFNLALHVGDSAQHVHANRAHLRQYFSFAQEPKWLHQTHSDIVVDAASVDADKFNADASYTTEPGVVCAVLTADCLPVVLSDKLGSCVGVVHAGWRGLLKGVVQRTIDAMSVHSRPEYAWLGPAIGPAVFDVGEDVYRPYLQHNRSFERAFAHAKTNKWKLDLYTAAKIVLNAADITKVYGGEYCTFTDSENFYSYRRSNCTGRMATLIWIK